MKRSDLSPSIKGLALKYKGLTKDSLENSLRWAKRKHKKYSQYLLTKDHYRKPIETNENYVYKELIFQGFVPESQFKKKPECNYLQTNRKVKGEILIYPVHCRHGYTGKNEYPEIYSMLSVAGLPGWVKVDVKFERIKEDGANKKNRKRKR